MFAFIPNLSIEQVYSELSLFEGCYLKEITTPEWYFMEHKNNIEKLAYDEGFKKACDLDGFEVHMAITEYEIKYLHEVVNGDENDKVVYVLRSVGVNRYVEDGEQKERAIYFICSRYIPECMKDLTGAESKTTLTVE